MNMLRSSAWMHIELFALQSSTISSQFIQLYCTLQSKLLPSHNMLLIYLFYWPDRDSVASVQYSLSCSLIYLAMDGKR